MNQKSNATVRGELPQITREQFERIARENLNQIREAYLKFNPNGGFLSMCIDAKDGYTSINNEYWKESKETAVNLNLWEEEPHIDTKREERGEK